MANYHVVPSDGQWGVRREGTSRLTSLHRLKQEAVDRARALCRSSGGGELFIHGLDGKIQSRDTVPPGNDPFPPRG